MVVVGIGLPGQVRQQVVGDIGPQFAAKRVRGGRAAGRCRGELLGLRPIKAGVERVDQTVVRRHVDHVATVLILPSVLAVTAVVVEQIKGLGRRADNRRRGADNIAQAHGLGDAGIVVVDLSRP